MRTAFVWTRRLVAAAVVGALVARVVQKLGVGDGGVVPVIGGDTWPPVPVKPTPAA